MGIVDLARRIAGREDGPLTSMKLPIAEYDLDMTTFAISRQANGLPLATRGMSAYRAEPYVARRIAAGDPPSPEESRIIARAAIRATRESESGRISAEDVDARIDREVKTARLAAAILVQESTGQARTALAASVGDAEAERISSALHKLGQADLRSFSDGRLSDVPSRHLASAFLPRSAPTQELETPISASKGMDRD